MARSLSLETNIQKQLLLDDNWARLRRSCNVKSPATLNEANVLKIIQEGRPSLPVACYLLGEIGTSLSLPVLRELAVGKTRDVSCSAILALAKIGDSNDIPLFEDLLINGGSLTAEYAMVALSKRGTANELSSVCKFGLKLIKKLKTPQNWDFPSGLLLAIQFASRYVGTNTADELLAIFESRKSSIIWRVEIDWVEQNWGLPDLDLALFKP